MRDWTGVGKRWRCAQCVIPLDYLELWQDSVSGDVFCMECWMTMGSNMIPVVEPIICDECGTPVKPTSADKYGRWSGQGEWIVTCEPCAEPLTEDEYNQAVAQLVELMEKTGEDG